MSMRQVAAIIVIILISIASIIADKRLDLEIDAGYRYDPPSSLQNSVRLKDEKIEKDGFGGRGCPLCDASVYSYCDYKIFHDACCCGLPAPQCQFSPCTFLHANSCAEHQLITRCCCYNPYRNL